MRRTLVALLLLLAFGGGLLAGPHPCQARETAPDPGTESKPSCHDPGSTAASHPGHEGQSAAPSSEDEGDCCAGEHGGGCEHACHLVALVQAPSSSFAFRPVARAAAPVPGGALPLFVHPVDHIPLA